MAMTFIDYVSIVLFVAAVLGVSMYKSRREKDSAAYFLAGRGATWWLIGFSLIAANISTEQFVGMSGAGAGNVGLAIASYEWIAAVTLVFVAIFFLPRFLSAGIFTIPEYLEYRYNAAARTIMSLFLMVVYVCVTIVAVVYSGGLTIHAIFDWPLVPCIWLIGILAAVYTVFGGLTAVIWADLIQGSALIVGGGIVLFLGLHAVAPEGGLVAGWESFMAQAGDKMHMSLPNDHPALPFTALLFGIWIPNFYYWGLNQYITQRTLASKSLSEGQKGVLFAAFLKLIIPFVIVIPGIMAWILFRDELGGSESAAKDAAYPVMIRHLVPAGLRGFMLAALAGAVMSSLASMLNSASTIFTMDVFKRYLKRDASEGQLVFVGRSTTVLFVVIGCLIAPMLANPRFGGVFHYIQDFQGFISPGILTAFVFGLIIKRTPPAAAIAAMIANVPIYGALHFSAVQTAIVKALPFMGSMSADGVGNIAFLNQMAVTAICLIIVMSVVTAIRPLEKPVVMPVNKGFDMNRSSAVPVAGAVIIVVTALLYYIFW
ncbi:MAG TPA: solute:sodium symporter family transporter [Candidatus Hydrogenedentes bacterium]|nr:solute:sodium symporter family transporter [Candidatus Hydrogenedentota bacterium]